MRPAPAPACAPDARGIAPASVCRSVRPFADDTRCDATPLPNMHSACARRSWANAPPTSPFMNLPIRLPSPLGWCAHHSHDGPPMIIDSPSHAGYGLPRSSPGPLDRLDVLNDIARRMYDTKQGKTFCGIWNCVPRTCLFPTSQR